METSDYRALVVKEEDGIFKREIQTRSVEDLPEGDLIIKVSYSSLNYKDALSATGNKGVTRNYPHTPGIDAAGTVISSDTGRFRAGDKVIVTGFDLGMNTDGGFGQYIRVPAKWALLLPGNLSMKEAMIIGTAGLTAGISVLKLTENIQPGDGPIVVSGATGGVGSLSVSILNKLGYSVTAITGKSSAHAYIKELGADQIVMREDFEAMMKKPLLKPAFAGAIDTAGGVILENIIKSAHPMGIVTCCGNVSSPQLELTVYPFILRGVTLIGIDSQNYPMKSREVVWDKLSGAWRPERLSETCTEITLDELSEKIDLMLAGKLQGRIVLKHDL